MAPPVQAADHKIDLLQIGTDTYTNVTITTKAAKYVFILHDGGMASIKVTELPADLQEQLGYKAKAKTNESTAVTWAKKKIAKVEAVPQVKKLQEKIKEQVLANAPTNLLAGTTTPATRGVPRIPPFNPMIIAAVLGAALLVYLFFCYCAMLICRKAGHEPGVLVWIPGLQMIPLFRAAGMSAWWFLALFVPILNLVTQILWCFKIAKARGKSWVVAVMLLLPLTNLLAYIYLAFSDGAKADEPKAPRRPQLMTLETA